LLWQVRCPSLPLADPWLLRGKEQPAMPHASDPIHLRSFLWLFCRLCCYVCRCGLALTAGLRLRGV